jgi:hypothetical protein
MSTIDGMTSVNIRSDFFDNAPTLDLSVYDSILAFLPEIHREYFKNLTYRLVLNGKSH